MKMMAWLSSKLKRKRKLKRFYLRWHIQIWHFGISLTFSLLMMLYSGMSFWACFLIAEFSLLANGWLADWEDRDEVEIARGRQRRLRFAKRLAILLATIGIVVGVPYSWDVLQDRRHSIEVSKDAELCEDWEPCYYPATPVEVKAGEKLKVLRIRHAKDFKMVKIEKENGESGWLISDDSIKLK